MVLGSKYCSQGREKKQTFYVIWITRTSLKIDSISFIARVEHQIYCSQIIKTVQLSGCFSQQAVLLYSGFGHLIPLVPLLIPITFVKNSTSSVSYPSCPSYPHPSSRQERCGGKDHLDHLERGELERQPCLGDTKKIQDMYYRSGVPQARSTGDSDNYDSISAVQIYYSV